MSPHSPRILSFSRPVYSAVLYTQATKTRGRSKEREREGRGGGEVTEKRREAISARPLIRRWRSSRWRIRGPASLDSSESFIIPSHAKIPQGQRDVRGASESVDIAEVKFALSRTHFPLCRLASRVAGLAAPTYIEEGVYESFRVQSPVLANISVLSGQYVLGLN